MTTATTTHTPKWEDLPIDNIVENYIRLKQNERERNKRSYEKLKLNQEKYYSRLNNSYMHQIDYIENIKNDEQKEKEFKQRRKEINKRAYLKRKQLQQL
jgi:hypothetical protein